MKKRVNIILSIIGILIALSYVVGIIVSLIFDTKETILWLARMATFGIAIYSAIKLNNKLKSKNNIDWANYHDLDTICGWLCFSSWCFLGMSILYIIFPINNYQSTYEPNNYSAAIVYFFISLFSFWSYISLILAKRNGLFLVRAYLISITSCLVMLQTILCTRIPDINLDSLLCATNWTSHDIFNNMIFPILGTLFVCSIIALCIKGLIISFRPHIVKLFKDSSISFLQILVILLLWVSIVAIRNTKITYTQTPQSNYPALNSSK